MEDISFTDIKEDTPVIEVESLCMKCERNGTTRIMLTKVPYFKEVILVHFQCPFCEYENNQVQYGGALEEKGAIYTCVLNSKEDYSRQIVRSEYATIRLHELDLELPNTSKRGVLTTIEGLLLRIIEDLSMEQAIRKIMQPEIHEKIEDLIAKMKDHLTRHNPLTISMDDPAGNSFIESLDPPSVDPKLTIKHYTRSEEQNASLGLHDTSEGVGSQRAEAESDSSTTDSVSVFHEPCYSCGVICETRMCLLKVPNFQEIVVMSTACEQCGYKNNEVKPTGSIAAKGKRITLHLKDGEDMSREVVKSDSCKVSIPELRFESILSAGKYTTVEGLLLDLIQNIQSRTPFLQGDSVPLSKREVVQTLVENLKKAVAVEPGHELTLVLDDPLGNTFVQALRPDGDDPNLIIAEYARSYEQNEEFGINDIKVDDY
ncbi:zinc-finger protein ZPR1 [Basidiobolus meristosporus CBS 931.73]|uniref:Zinc-finger protein ZPR1 n=1 Tax=Basidiobolus meristosporus CBS 931.73 TaxID=1314790 RepID=A0A1Y1XCG5_9FUNG|nr:zinc-finger protein ZPR1 [Basidiobolus meristosporus CBS 931.73]|eukprot:ORX83407.1 zinc-finger protein ZPR1 [Basidiobolus meristosporus CBS 931.73]